MPYYLSPYIGTGIEPKDPFRPRGAAQPGWSSIDLRPDCSRVSGFALLHLPVPVIDTQLVKLAEDKLDILPALVRSALGNRLSVFLADVRFDQIISQLLIAPPLGKWKALRPCLSKKRWEILLGNELIWEMPLVGGGASYSDNFDRADAEALGLSWSAEIVGDIDLVSNKAQQSPATDIRSEIRWNQDLASDDHWAQATAQVLTAGNRRAGPTVRHHATARDYYCSAIDEDTNNVDFSKVVTGTWTQIATYAIAIATLTDYIVKVQIDGSTYTVWLDGTQRITGTDTSLTGNLRSGLYMAGPNASSALNDWSCGDVVAGGQLLRPRSLDGLSPFYPAMDGIS